MLSERSALVTNWKRQQSSSLQQTEPLRQVRTLLGSYDVYIGYINVKYIHDGVLVLREHCHLGLR